MIAGLVLSCEYYYEVEPGSQKYRYAMQGAQYKPDHKQYPLETVCGLADFKPSDNGVFELVDNGQLARFQQQVRDMHPTESEKRRKQARHAEREHSAMTGGASGGRQFRSTAAQRADRSRSKGEHKQ